MENKLFDIKPINIDPDMKGVAGSFTFKGMYKSVYRICRFAFPLLNELGIGVRFKSGTEIYKPKNPHSSKEWTKIARFYEKGKTGMSTLICDKTRSEEELQTLIFIRKHDADWNDYPRLHLPTEVKQRPDSEKIPAMLQMCKKMKLYFLLILLNETGGFNAKPTLCWFGKYEDIPVQNWGLSDRFGKGMKDRMSVTSQKRLPYNFVRKEQLKEVIIQNF